MSKLLQIKNLYAKSGNKSILKGLNLTINEGETHVIMGPNGAGKSTLASCILSNPAFAKTRGKIIFDNADITNMPTDEIARKGIFLSFQNPEEIAGVSVINFIKSVRQKTTGKSIYLPELKAELDKNIKALHFNEDLISRDLNVGFSGGEKKKNEILQLLTFNPRLAILDETDSGLDVDAINIVSRGIAKYRNENNSALIITHSTKILKKLDVTKVHILVNGKIVYTGGPELATIIEEKGYSEFLK